MRILNFDDKKNKKAMKTLIAKHAKNAKGFTKFCYYTTMILKILAVVLALASIIYIVATESDLFYLIYTSLCLFIPYGLSFIPKAYYTTECSLEYKYRSNQSVTVNDDGFVYSYRNSRILGKDVTVLYKVDYKKLNHYEYDEKTKVLKLSGGIDLTVYENGVADKTVPSDDISLLNVYDEDIVKLIKNNQ